MPEDITPAVDPASIEQDVALLGEDDEIQNITPPLTGEEPKEELQEEKEEEKVEKVEEETEEEGEEGQILSGRPTFKEIKEKYPTIFKDFPGLRDTFFREKQYTEVFPTIEDARTAAQVVNVFGHLQSKLAEGDAEHFVRGLENGGISSKFAENILPTLHKVNPQLYIRAVTPQMLNLINKMNQHGQQTGDASYIGSAQRVCLMLFGTKTPPRMEELFGEEQQSQKEDPEKVRLQQQLQETQSRLVGEFQEALSSEAVTDLRRSAAYGIDPEAKLSDYEKNALVDRIINDAVGQIKSNPSIQSELNSLWKQAERHGYTKEWKDRILTAYLGRAKPILQAVKSKVLGKKVEAKPIGKNIPANRSVPSKAGKPVSAREVDWDKTSDADFLADKVVLKNRR